MSSFKSEKVDLNYSAEKVFNKLSNLENLKYLLEKVPADKIPEDQRQTLEQIEVTPETISIPAGPVGSMTLRLTEKKEPTLICLEAENSPVEMALIMHIEPVSESSCRIMIEIDRIPKMLAMMIGGMLTKMADQFAQMIRMIPFD